jgi:hypothetical protein
MIGNFRASSVIYLTHDCVLPAIDLDGQSRGRTGEIDNVPADRMLAAKTVRRLRLAQRALGFRHISSETSGDYRPLPHHRH